jgi:hypothetical protein
MNHKEKDPDWLNAELIEQIKWFQSKTRLDERNDIIQGMAASRRDQWGPKITTMSMHFWIHVEKWTMGRVV